MILSKLKVLLTALEYEGAVRAIFTWPKFSMASFLIVSRLKQVGVAPLTVIDLGANVGQFALAAANLFNIARIYSIEPDPRTAEQLRANLKGIKWSEVFVVAVGDTVGEAEFHVNKDCQVSSLLPLGRDRQRAFPRSTVAERIHVPVTTLDILFKDRQLDAPILLKIDVQGFEDRVILGGTKFLQGVQWIVMEVSFADLYEGERDFSTLSALMSKQGFRFVRPLNFHTSPLGGDIIEMDALFTRAQA